MESSDRELLIEIHTQQGIIIRRLDSLEKRTANLEQQAGHIEQEQKILRVQVEALQTSVYWVLAAIGIFLAAIAVIPAFRKKEDKPAPQSDIHPEAAITPSEIMRMINAAMDARLPKNS